MFKLNKIITVNKWFINSHTLGNSRGRMRFCVVQGHVNTSAILEGAEFVFI